MKAPIGGRHEEHRLYYLDVHVVPTSYYAVVSPLDIHCRLGHPSLATLKSMVPNLQKVQSLECETCHLGKHHRASSRPRHDVRVPHPFMLVHTDVWGPCPVVSKLDFKYFITFVNGYFRCTWLYLMKDRTEVFSIFQTFCAEVKTQFAATI